MYKKSSQGWLKHFDFILLDLISLQLAFILAYVLRHGFANPYAVPVYRKMAVLIMLIDIAVIFFHETFRNVLKRGYWKEFSITVKHAVLVLMLSIVYLFSTQESQAYSRSAMYLTVVSYGVITYFLRLFWKRKLKGKMAVAEARSLLIITTSDIASRVLANLRENNYELFKITGIILADRNAAGEQIDGIPVVGGAEDALAYVGKEWVDEVLINQSEKYEISQSFINELVDMGVTVHLNLAKAEEMKGRKNFVEKIGGCTVLSFSLNCMTPKQAFMKRAMDIVVGLAGCLITGILFIFIAPAIYIQSPGPIFFSQTRVGKNGKLFKIYKFRSMYMDAEERKKELMEQNRVKDGLMFKMEFDPRVIGNKILPDGTRKTGIGEFIRRSSIDEFPQFWNVLNGSMSVVGTRPPLPSEVAIYENHHHARLAAKPGITGMWQVSGRSDITDFEEVVRLDTQYINEWSIGLDLKILLKTVKVVLKREGSM